jgi:hypothetical protein
MRAIALTKQNENESDRPAGFFLSYLEMAGAACRSIAY